MDLADLDALAGVAATGSLSGAAKRLGVSVSTAARRLDALEAALKLRLVDRRASGARLTAHGVRIAALAEPLLDQAAQLGRSAAALRAGAGREMVRVSATEFVVSDLLAPALPAFWARHPGIAVQLQGQGGVVSLANRDADLAVRMSRPEGNSLVARKLNELRLGLYAAPAYLAGRDPARLDLAAERLLAYDDSYGRLPELDWLDRLGLSDAVAMRTGSTRALLTATQAGGGIGLLPHIFTKGLVAVPLPAPLAPRTPWLVAHRDLRRLPQIAAVHGWITQSFARAVRGAPA